MSTKYFTSTKEELNTDDSLNPLSAKPFPKFACVNSNFTTRFVTIAFI